MPSRMDLSFADYGSGAHPDGETSHVSFDGVALTVGNFTAQTGLMDDLAAAVAGVQIGVLVSDKRFYNMFEPGNGPAADPDAQREQKWLCRYHDTISHSKFKLEIPCADRSLLLAHQEQMDLAGTEGAALKAAFEAFVVSPENPAHSVVLDSCTMVGRNL